MPGALKLLAAEQRGIKMVKKFFTFRKRRGINPNTSTPVPFSLRRRGVGDEVNKAVV
jgi:hypothetical protein